MKERGVEVQETAVQTDRVLTVPNILSGLRLIGIPVFLWLVLVVKADGWAFWLIVLSAFTDYVDGYLARKWRQISRLGQLLDPIVDRAFIVSLLAALALRDLIPWWFAGLLIARDLVMFVVMSVLKRHGQTGLPVHFLGKSATFALMGGLPLLLLTSGTGTGPMLAAVFGWAASIWGAALYWWAAALYIHQTRRLLRVLDGRDSGDVPGDAPTSAQPGPIGQDHRS
jgi:cardiolipin synthase (CMP-forming)